jgi:hypothetical protein
LLWDEIDATAMFAQELTNTGGRSPAAASDGLAWPGLHRT